MKQVRPLPLQPNEPVEGFGYWDSHPDYPICDWAYEASNGDTRAGYWEWVRNHIAWKA